MSIHASRFLSVARLSPGRPAGGIMTFTAVLIGGVAVVTNQLLGAMGGMNDYDSLFSATLSTFHLVFGFTDSNTMHNAGMGPTRTVEMGTDVSSVLFIFFFVFFFRLFFSEVPFV